ncbi:MAG: exodeoxyribonuclease VII small subunit [Ignavibacteriaceae bacterium]|jgi:exodeoxyribonuclease VII small subunit
MGKKTDKNSFESKLSRLEEISSLLEKDDIGLEEAINLYEEGIELSRNCILILNEAELKVTKLKKKLDELSLNDKGLAEE